MFFGRTFEISKYIYESSTNKKTCLGNLYRYICPNKLKKSESNQRPQSKHSHNLNGWFLDALSKIRNTFVKVRQLKKTCWWNLYRYICHKLKKANRTKCILNISQLHNFNRCWLDALSKFTNTFGKVWQLKNTVLETSSYRYICHKLKKEDRTKSLASINIIQWILFGRTSKIQKCIWESSTAKKNLFGNPESVTYDNN